MEIKEVNSIMNFLTGNKTSVASNSVGADFLSLLGNKTEVTSESKKSASQQTVAYSSKDKTTPVAKETKNKASSANSDTKKNSSIADEKSSALDSEKTKNKVNDNGNNDSKDIANKKPDSKDDVTSDVVAGGGTKEQAPVEADKNEAATGSESKVEADTPVDADTVIPEVADSVGEKIVSIDALALMGILNVLNPSTGVMEAKTGAELAAQFASQSGVAAVQLVASADGSIIAKPLGTEQLKQIDVASKSASLPIDGMEAVVDGEAVNLVQNLQTVTPSSKEVPVKTPEAVVVTEGLADEKIVQQADEISGIIGEDKKLNIKVSVKEEKFAYQTSSDLIANKLVVDEVVGSSFEPKVNAATLPQEPTLVQNNSNHTANAQGVINANAPIVAAINAQATPVVDAAVSAPALAIKSVEASSSTLSQAAGSSSEFVNASKLEAANADNKTTFRDVYKGMSKEVIDQVKVNITKSAVRGIDKIEIQLKPEDLGNIEVKMQIKDGKLHAHIISSRPDTMDILQKDIQTLEKAFQDAGFQTDDSSLSFSFRGEQEASQNQDSGLRRFIGNALSEETNSEVLSSETLNAQSYDGTSALNIRV